MNAQPLNLETAASASVFLAAVDAPAWIAILAAGLLGWFLGPSIAERR
jgi:hypothetical protein